MIWSVLKVGIRTISFSVSSGLLSLPSIEDPRGIEQTLTVVNLHGTGCRQLQKWRFHWILTAYRGRVDTTPSLWDFRRMRKTPAARNSRIFVRLIRGKWKEPFLHFASRKPITFPLYQKEMLITLQFMNEFYAQETFKH